jgi:1-deoxy-D-xylulose 5-phosphate reductoisomerase
VLNAANEVAVAAFLEGRLGFRAMSRLIADMLHSTSPTAQYDLETLSAVDSDVRRRSLEALPYYNQ